jgi:DNA-binding GntR family transcriptional regulator
MTQAATLATTAYDRLRADVISGQFAAGGKIRIKSICEAYGIGASPVREALNRLCSEKLIHQTDQKGFRVLPLTLNDLDELTRARCWANEVSVRNSIRNAGLDWEVKLTAAFETLAATPRYLSETSPVRNPDWGHAHEAFHAALISACGSSWIYEFCTQMSWAAERYRHAARIATNTRRKDLDEHRAIYQAAISRQEDEAAKLLNDHFRHTARLVRENLVAMAAESKTPNSATSSKRLIAATS